MNAIHEPGLHTKRGLLQAVTKRWRKRLGTRAKIMPGQSRMKASDTTDMILQREARDGMFALQDAPGADDMLGTSDAAAGDGDAEHENAEQENVAAPQESEDPRAKYARLNQACRTEPEDWVLELDTSIDIPVIKACMADSNALPHWQLRLGSNDWQHEQHARTAYSKQRDYRIVVSAEQEMVNWYLQRNMRNFLGQEDGTPALLQCGLYLKHRLTESTSRLAFRLLMRGGGALVAHFRRAQRSDPELLFTALISDEHRRQVLDKARCVYGQFSKSILEAFLSVAALLSKPCQARLHNAAQDILVEIESLEQDHGATRRCLMVHTQTHVGSLELVSAKRIIRRQLAVEKQKILPYKQPAAETEVPPIAPPAPKPKRAKSCWNSYVFRMVKELSCQATDPVLSDMYAMRSAEEILQDEQTTASSSTTTTALAALPAPEAAATRTRRPQLGLPASSSLTEPCLALVPDPPRCTIAMREQDYRNQRVIAWDKEVLSIEQRKLTHDVLALRTYVQNKGKDIINALVPDEEVAEALQDLEPVADPLVPQILVKSHAAARATVSLQVRKQYILAREHHRTGIKQPTVQKMLQDDFRNRHRFVRHANCSKVLGKGCKTLCQRQGRCVSCKTEHRLFRKW